MKMNERMKGEIGKERKKKNSWKERQKKEGKETLK